MLDFENRSNSEAKYPVLKEGFLWWEFGIFIFNNLFLYGAGDPETLSLPLPLVLMDAPPIVIFVLFFIFKYIYSKSDQTVRSLRTYRKRLEILTVFMIALIFIMPVFILEGDLNFGGIFLYPIVLIALVTPFPLLAGIG